ncbi:glycosyltransferase family 2 protein [Aliiroseovarius sediminis]|uniref:glycosyltransferase family 2 protein n=1 Tax=Aliiroseovarius sediminis TaxID=2925839 RepID=UPI001F560532|nr:glycosyltransferase family 2 protein [Aliiroseovarius sediminis]MCI2394628.1 glycosyltransferase family 2 protein [Aliiroseovarius sediminis]
MGVWTSYRLRLKRQQCHLRALRKRRQLAAVTDRTEAIRADDILAFSTIRNEHIRLPYFLDYYRTLGVNHFLIVDNGSDDGGREYLAEQPDVSLWTTTASYKSANFGVHWIGWLQRKYADGHWALTVDPDELLVYPFHDTRPLRALTDWLDTCQIRSFGTLLLDMYPKGVLDAQPYAAGQDPFEIANWFDSGNYSITKNPKYGNLWIQGGPRARVFFHDKPIKAPALNKIPLVKWSKRYAYVSSTHALLPRGLNLVYDQWGGEKASGCLLHAKFLDTFSAKSAEELERGQHYANSYEYRAYHRGTKEDTDLWCDWSEKYLNWRQLEALGLMSKGNWA